MYKGDDGGGEDLIAVAMDNYAGLPIIVWCVLLSVSITTLFVLFKLIYIYLNTCVEQ